MPGSLAHSAVVGVGKDAAGTLYVDAANGVFVSASGKLLRQHVTGSGESGTTESLFSFEAPGDDGSGAQNLLVETTGAAADAMALGPAGSKAFLKALGEGDQKAAGLIGQFGVGFYSAFMVAKSVKVFTHSWRESEPSLVWTSDGAGSFA